MNNLGADGAAAASKSLVHNRSLVKLDLTYNSIGGLGARAFVVALEKLKAGLHPRGSTLRTLDIRANAIPSHMYPTLEDAGVGVSSGSGLGLRSGSFVVCTQAQLNAFVNRTICSAVLQVGLRVLSRDVTPLGGKGGLSEWGHVSGWPNWTPEY